MPRNDYNARSEPVALPTGDYCGCQQVQVYTRSPGAHSAPFDVKDITIFFDNGVGDTMDSRSMKPGDKSHVYATYCKQDEHKTKGSVMIQVTSASSSPIDACTQVINWP